MVNFQSFPSFQFEISRIISGPGSSKNTGEIILSNRWKRALVVADPGVLSLGIAEPVLQSLKKAEISFEIFSRIKPNPRDLEINEGASLFRGSGAEVVVGIGGGSALDTAKALAMLLTNEGAINDYDGVGKVRHKPLPVIAIPTTAGTGSEVTGNIAFTDTKLKDKLSCRSSLNIPSFAVLDPELLICLPPHVISSSSMDAVVHAIEGYLSRRSNPFTDAMALQAIEWGFKYALLFYANPKNITAGSFMLLASMLAGSVIFHTGTGNAHGIARPLGGLFDVPHGLTCAILLPSVMRFNLPVSETKLARMAERLNLVSVGTNSLAAADAAIKATRRLFKEAGVPKTLTQFKIDEGQIDHIAELALKNVDPNPRPTTVKDIKSILGRLL
jgi:alcohol dehydrogenase class IV